MDDLEIDRLQLEKVKVAASRAEMEFQIKQRQSEIRRVQIQIDKQLVREAELTAKITELTKQGA